jgi:integrase
MIVPAVLDAAGRRRSPATMPGYHAGRPPRNKGQLYPADPPTVEEIVAVMREASDDRHGYRLHGPVVVLWRGGLHRGGADARRARPRLPARLAARAQRQGRPAPRGRHGSSCAPGSPLDVIQRQLGHANLGTTSIYLQGIDTEEIIATVHARRARSAAPASSPRRRER